MNGRLENRVAALEAKIKPPDPEESLYREGISWLLGSYAEVDAELRKLPNYRELKALIDEEIQCWYSEPWLQFPMKDPTKVNVEMNRRIRQEFLKVTGRELKKQ